MNGHRTFVCLRLFLPASALTILTLMAATSGCMTPTVEQNSTTPVPSLSAMSTAIISGSVTNSLSGATSSGQACPTASSSQRDLNCSTDTAGKTLTLLYKNCSIPGSSGPWQGSQILTSSNSVSCGTFPLETPGSTLNRTFGTGTQFLANNSEVQLDTTSSSGFEFSVVGGTQVTFIGAGIRKLAIAGVHVVAPSWDYSLSSNILNPIDINVGTGAKIVNGTVTVQDNTSKITGASVFTNVIYSMLSTCCHPQSGTVTTTFTGTKTGSEVLTFSSLGCGSAILKDSSGSSSAVALTNCF